MSNHKYDFSGWATRANVRCSDGRIIANDAFKDCDGIKVPLVWNHNHKEPEAVLGHALLENRSDGVYAYCSFNDTDSAKSAKLLVQHGDIVGLSIYANKLKEKASNVLHGAIREVSLVIAGANPGAFIDAVEMSHSDDTEWDAIIYSGEDIELYHSEDEDENEDTDEEDVTGGTDSDVVEHSDKEKEDSTNMAEEKKEKKTVEDVINTMNDEQKLAMATVVGQIAKDLGYEDKEDTEEDEKVKHNVFDGNDEYVGDAFLTHADQEEIISTAKKTGSLMAALSDFAEDHFEHGFENIEKLFPDYKDVYPGAPELITRDRTWVNSVMSGVKKSPISRIRTRQMDVRPADFRALGYKKGAQKLNGPDAKLLSRSTDPQTVYRKDQLDRDDIIDITDFDVVNYQYQIMRGDLEEEIARAILIGDGRDDNDRDKISEEHIRSVYNDAELYTIHQTVDVETMRTTLNGTDTGAHFGENYIYAEAIIQTALYARENYRGSGSLTFYCTPHLANVMLLARDLNGRRIYSSMDDLRAALNVSAIETVEQFEGVTRTEGEGASAVTKDLLGIFVNLSDYQVGSTKGGEITTFNQFDIDFNKEKYLIETRLSGALTKIKSAIVLEQPHVEEVTPTPGTNTNTQPQG